MRRLTSNRIEDNFLENQDQNENQDSEDEEEAMILERLVEPNSINNEVEEELKEQEQEIEIEGNESFEGQGDSMLIDDEILDMGLVEDHDEKRKEDEENVATRWSEVPINWEPSRWLREYLPQPGPSNQIPESTIKISDYFKLFFDEEVLSLLVTETNRYANQYFSENPQQRRTTHFKDWNEVTAEKMSVFIGLMIHMGLKYPRAWYHWSSNDLYSCAFCPNFMKRKEFMLINNFLHVVDNQNCNVNDKLYKIRPLMNHFIQRWQRYYILNKRISIDERMIPFRGRISFLQYLPSKPVKWGIKAFLLADAHNGYVHNMKIYCGSGGQRTQSPNNMIVELTEGLRDLGHHVYFDNYYCSVPIVENLSTKGIGCTGTIQKNRRFLPKEIKNPDNLVKGQAIYKKKGNLLALVYKDKRDVRILTNMHNNQLSHDGKPIALNDYSRWMRGVDRSNQYNSYYRSGHKSKKWWRAIFNSLIDTAISNAFILYKCKNPERKITILNFREQLAMELCNAIIQRPRIQNISRLIPELHQIGIRSQKNCAICSRTNERKTSRYYCIDCNKNICVVPCFYILHTKATVTCRKKDRNTL